MWRTQRILAYKFTRHGLNGSTPSFCFPNTFPWHLFDLFRQVDFFIVAVSANLRRSKTVTYIRRQRSARRGRLTGTSVPDVEK